MHITSQKSDGRGTSHLHNNGILVLVIPLRLPVEGPAPGITQAWFEKMGLSQGVPVAGASQPTAANINITLNTFMEQLNGTYREIPCQNRNGAGFIDKESPIWYMFDTPAYITGSVVQSFKDAFPYETSVVGNFRPVEVEGKRQIVTFEDRGKSYKPAPVKSWKRLGGGQGGSDVQTDNGEVQAATQVIEGMAWRPNPNFKARQGEFQPMGEWVIPAATTSAAPPTTTVDPVPAELVRLAAAGDVEGVKKLVDGVNQARDEAKADEKAAEEAKAEAKAANEKAEAAAEKAAAEEAFAMKLKKEAKAVKLAEEAARAEIEKAQAAAAAARYAAAAEKSHVSEKLRTDIKADVAARLANAKKAKPPPVPEVPGDYDVQPAEAELGE
jgi:hypothetical protein